jgi:membrane-associated PAP2 superfamily phosphatase
MSQKLFFWDTLLLALISGFIIGIIRLMKLKKAKSQNEWAMIKASILCFGLFYLLFTQKQDKICAIRGK